MKETGIYRITCWANCRVYVGQSGRGIAERWGVHIRQLNANRHPNPFLQADWNRFGPEQFVFEVIEIVTDAAALDRRENLHINKAKGYAPMIYNVKHPKRYRRKPGQRRFRRQ